MAPELLLHSAGKIVIADAFEGPAIARLSPAYKYKFYRPVRETGKIMKRKAGGEAEKKIRHGCCPNQVHELKTLLFHGKENSLISFPCFQLSSSSKLLSFFSTNNKSPPAVGLKAQCGLVLCVQLFCQIFPSSELLVFASLQEGRGKDSCNRSLP